jgi:hypothetical protein
VCIHGVGKEASDPGPLGRGTLCMFVSRDLGMEQGLESEAFWPRPFGYVCRTRFGYCRNPC